MSSAEPFSTVNKKQTARSLMHIIISSVSARQLAEAIVNLSASERVVIALMYFERLSEREISQVLGINVTLVSESHFTAAAFLTGLLLEHSCPQPSRTVMTLTEQNTEMNLASV